MKKYAPTTKYMFNAGMAVCLCISFFSSATADDRTPSEPFVYYQMGGGDSISDALNPGVTLSANRLGPAFRQPSSCEIWENRENLAGYAETIINDFIETKMESAAGLVQNMTIAVKSIDKMAAIAALERALPGMYDWMNQMTGMINNQLEVSMNSCRAAVGKQRAGSSVLDSWLDVSTNIAWRKTLDPDYAYNTDDTHINKVARTIHEKAPSTPIPWFGGDSGAIPGKPIKVTEGIISAGYAASASTSYTGTAISGPPTAPNTVINPNGTTSVSPTETRLAKLFPTSAEAVAFATQVLGEESILYCNEPGCDTDITAGIGLKATYSAERARLLEAWAKLLQDYPPNTINNPKLSEFDDVSSQGVRITKQVYNVLRRQTPQNRNVYIYKFVSDVAIANTVEKALALIEMVNSGVMAPQVQSYTVTREKAKRLENIAKESIESLMYEINIMKGLTSDTAQLLLASDAAFLEAAARMNPGNGAPTVGTTIRGGEVYERGE